MKRYLCVFLTIVIILSSVSVCYAADYVSFMANAYDRALELANNTDFDGKCGRCVGMQLYALGINNKFIGHNGNDMYNTYSNINTTSGGYKVNKYPASKYSLSEFLGFVNSYNNSGEYTFISLGFEKGSSSSAGQSSGHTLLVYAVYNGVVYFTESWGTTIRTQSISDFSYSYRCRVASNGKTTYEYEGAVWFINDGSTPTIPSTPEEPETEIVDSPTLSVQAGTTGTNTIFSWNAVEGASSYDLKIWKDCYLEGSAYINKTDVASGIGISLPVGQYYAYIDACNSTMTDWKMSNIVSFKVVEMTSPTLAVKAGTANTNSTFTWNSVNGASSYNLKIWKDSYLEGNAYISKTNVSSGIGISLPTGTYYAYIDACNSTMTDWKMSNIVSFKVVEMTSPTLAVKAGTANTNSTFTWNSVNGASSYNLKIWKDSYLEGSAYISKTDVASGIGISLPVGQYYAYIDACNSTMTDWKMSNIVSFKVVELVSPTLTVNAGTTGSNTIFTWNAVEGASSYDLKIWKDSYLEGSAYINKTDVPSGIGISLPVGTYYAYIDACNSTMSDWKMSNIVSFKVVDAIPHITSNVKKVGNKFIVNVNLINIDTSYEVIVAGYNSERLVDVKIVSNITDSINLTGEINEIKVMVWESLSTIRPLCEAEEITSDELIIE